MKLFIFIVLVILLVVCLSKYYCSIKKDIDIYLESKSELEEEIKNLAEGSKGSLRIKLNDFSKTFVSNRKEEYGNIMGYEIFIEINEIVVVQTFGKKLLFYSVIEPQKTSRKKGRLYCYYSLNINDIDFYRFIEQKNKYDILFCTNINCTLKEKECFFTEFMYMALKHFIPEKDESEILKQRNMNFVETLNTLYCQVSRFEEIVNYCNSGSDINYYKIELVKLKKEYDEFETELFRIESESDDLTNNRLEFI